MDKTQASTGKSGDGSTGRISVPTPAIGGGGNDRGAGRAKVPTATGAGGGGGNGSGQSDGSGGGGGGASVTGSASVPTSLPSAGRGGDTGGGESDEATQSQQGAPSQAAHGGGSNNTASGGTCGTGAQSPTPGVAVSLILPGTLTASAKQDSSDSEDQDESPPPVKSSSPTTPHPKSKRKRHGSDSDEVEEEEDENVDDDDEEEEEEDEEGEDKEEGGVNEEEEEDENESDSSSVAEPPASSKKSKAASSMTPSKKTARPSSAKPKAIKTPRSQPAKKAKGAASTPSSGKPPASKTPRGKTPRSSSIVRSRAKHVPNPGDQAYRKYTVSARGRSKTIECLWPDARTTVRKIVPVVRDEQLWVVHPDDYAGSKKKHFNIRDVYMVKCKDIVLGYLVEWVDGVEDWYSRQDLTVGSTVDPNNPTNLDKWLAMIDRFMDDRNQHILHDFVRSDPFGSTFNLGDSADLDGLCGFRAVETALMWCGAPSGLVTQKVIDDYCAQAMKRTDKRIDMKKTGVTYQQLRGFVNQLSKESGSVDLKVLNKNLYCGRPHGLKGVVAAVDDGQTDGVYLVSGRAQFIKVGHVIALRKVGMKLICKDGLGESELLDQQWLGNLSYVRRFVWTTSAN